MSVGGGGPAPANASGDPPTPAAAAAVVGPAEGDGALRVAPSTRGSALATPADAPATTSGVRAAVDGPAPVVTEVDAPATAAAVQTCSWAACGSELSGEAAAKFRCSRCKREHYCSRTCQKRHWGRGGHKVACAEPPCCTICLDGGDEPVPIQRGCACRGDAGLAHVACLAEAAARKAGGQHVGWSQCTTCGQQYTGAMELGLQRELVHRLRTRPRHDLGRLCAEGNLGNALRELGQLAEAADVLARVLRTMKRAYGEDNASTLGTASMLAVTYRHQGKLAEGEKLLVWVLEANTRLNGKEHPDTLDATTNLANIYSKQDRLAEAEELQVEALRANTRVHGIEHLATMNATTNLATTYGEQGKHADAEELRTGVLAVSRRVLGAEHPTTLHCAGNLAFSYTQQGRLAEAEELQVDTLEACRRVQGAAHPDTLRTASDLAHTYGKQGRDADAQELRALYHF